MARKQSDPSRHVIIRWNTPKHKKKPKKVFQNTHDKSHRITKSWLEVDDKNKFTGTGRSSNSYKIKIPRGENKALDHQVTDIFLYGHSISETIRFLINQARQKLGEPL